MGLVTIRNARVLSISFLVLIHYFNNDIRYLYTTNQTTIGNDIDPNDGAPEESLPEHHVPLPWDYPDSITPNHAESNVTNSTPSTIWFDAVDTNGNRGYVADPTLFRRLVLQWHSQHGNATYFDRLEHYQSHLQLNVNSTNLLTMDEICSLTESKGGHELNDGGVKMLMNVKVDATPVLRKGCTESPPLQKENPHCCTLPRHGWCRIG